MRWGAIAVGFVLALAAQSAALAKGPFEDWAAVVVAGDWRASGSGRTDGFDNARRDVSARLVELGFDKASVAQFSTKPELYDDNPARTDLKAIYETLRATAEHATGGCLVYYTSHGAPQGVVLDVEEKVYLVSPDLMTQLVDEACPGRPTIVIISACYSGVFVPALQAPQRMILTAARPDRTSFGCGQTNRYPYFDDCFLQTSNQVHDFAALGPAVQACVARMEAETGMAPPSEPQFWMGAAIKPILPLMAFTGR